MIIEPVLGEGGYIPAPVGFLEGIAARCAEHGILFIADEVQCGFGRTGAMFAVEHYDVEPDIICMAKGIASGFPFAALGMRRELDDLWPTGSHGGTYGGNPIGCAAALATIEILTAPGFLADVTAMGARLRRGLAAIGAEHGAIRQIRGLGLMLAAEFDTAAIADRVRRHCLEQGRLITMTAGAAGTTLRFMPPLTVSSDEVDIALAAINSAVRSGVG